WDYLCFVDVHFTTTEMQNYQFTYYISDVLATSLSYRLKQIDYDGSFEYSDVVEVSNPAPTDFILHQNYPNPFNPETIIKYGIPTKTNVQLSIYNALGEMIKVLLNEVQTAGNYEVPFNASNLPSGIYFYRIQAEAFVETKKMVLMK
ncbi:MAG: T9SS type A sorting domain-containing protein, partial [Ignavibacteria bacterium]|nr:T9SS type A sorting domain-containing protein [Ignavibacteria bacterium]